MRRPTSARALGGRRARSALAADVIHGQEEFGRQVISLVQVSTFDQYGRMPDIILPPRDQFLPEEIIRGGMDLLFFANTRYLKHADDMLATHSLGRAHHRVMYFVARCPGIHVAALLTILGVRRYDALPVDHRHVLVQHA